MKLATLGMLCGAYAATDYSSSTSSSSAASTKSFPPITLQVWTTMTIAGKPVPTQIEYSQSFYALWSTVASPSSGAIGLGTIKGDVGTYRADGAAEPVQTVD